MCVNKHRFATTTIVLKGGHTMKKSIALIISLAMLASVTACSDKPKNNDSENSKPVSESATDENGEVYK